MKEFLEFRKTISEDLLKQWDDEIMSDLIPKLDETYKEDPVSWQTVFSKSYSFQTSIRLLEAYHQWLNK